MTQFQWGAATDTGRIRQANEDSYLAVDGLFAVADGMGGHQAGEVASRSALESLHGSFVVSGTDVLVAAVEGANQTVLTASLNDATLAGMGTTLVAMALVDAAGRDAIGVVNVGDSRLYLLTDGDMAQITEDHSLVATMERQGRITAAEAAVHPQRNILIRALGIDGSVLVDSWEILPVVGDRYLLCSDGLFNEVEDNRIAATLRRLADPNEACRELVRLANEGGGRDNITCVIVDVVDDSGRDPDADLSSRVRSSHTGGDAMIDDGSGTTPPKRQNPPGELRQAMTWRVGAFVGTIFLLVVLAFGFVWWTGTQTWYVGVQGDQVAIFHGKPGGVLWVKPQFAESTNLALSQVPAAALAAVQSGVEEPSLEAARIYVANLIEQYEKSTTTTTMDFSSSTVSPTSTSTAPR